VAERDIEILRASFDAFNRGDYDAALSGVSADVEFEPPGDAPLPTAYQGHEGAKRFWGSMRDVFDEFRSEPEEIVDAGRGRYVVPVTERFRTKGSQPEIVESNAIVFTMTDGKVVRVQIFTDRAKAFEAVGLSAPGQH